MEIETLDQDIRKPFFAVDSLVREWCVDVLELVENFDDVYGARLDPVEAHSRDGFFAYTAGGYDGWGYANMAHAYGSGATPSAVQLYLDSRLKDCDAEWDSNNPEHTLAWIHEENDAAQLEMLGPSSEREHWREKYWEFEDEWLSEGGIYFYKIRAIYHDSSTVTRSLSGEPEILFCVGINTDFEYGRDSIPWLKFYGGKTQQTEWPWERTVKVADLTPTLLAEMAQQAKDALRNA